MFILSSSLSSFPYFIPLLSSLPLLFFSRCAQLTLIAVSNQLYEVHRLNMVPKEEYDEGANVLMLYIYQHNTSTFQAS